MKKFIDSIKFVNKTETNASLSPSLKIISRKFILDRARLSSNPLLQSYPAVPRQEITKHYIDILSQTISV